MDDPDFLNYDASRLRIELEQEKQMMEMLVQSSFELRNTVADLEKKLDTVENEGNEWKTRFETQQELNRQLERQITVLQEKREDVGNPIDRLSSIRSYEEMPVGALKQLLKQLETEKKRLQSQLKDYSIRIEQESKAYHKANEERRAYLHEISQTTAIIEANKKHHVTEASEMHENQKRSNYSVPANKRTYNAKQQALKKQSTVLPLPKLKH
ncbi:coiled-coil domain containing 169 [Erpetoichthys calabaricus]|uniref:Coiled-coil domain containing 169 n=1 Tax=Erpetoichthys calabaricus TaxID=27687 RepID=A0A8C4RIZ0_ERPCA|nr:coiled-coil domain containing 169 [Erpetoichthys calabaricus]